MKKRMLFILISLLSFGLPVQAADDPIRLELKFGIEEERRPSHIIGVEAKARVKKMLNPNRTAFRKNILLSSSDLAETKIEVGKAATRLEENILARCLNHPTLRCVKGQFLSDDKRAMTGLLFTDLKGNRVGYIELDRDNLVIEIKANPFKRNDLSGATGEMIQLAAFDAPADLKLNPARFLGEGHIHIDFDSLFKTWRGIDYRMFRNYVVDWVNHDELYYGVLNYDEAEFKSAPMLKNDDDVRKFTSWLADYEIAMENGTIKDDFYDLLDDLHKDLGFSKGRALNVDGHESGTIEIRSLRNKRDMQELNRVLSLLEERANYLKNLDGDLEFHNVRATNSSQMAVNRFYRYVTESKLDWDEYKKLMPKPWQKITPKVLPDEKFFAQGTKKSSKVFNCSTWMLIHLFGK